MIKSTNLNNNGRLKVLFLSNERDHTKSPSAYTHRLNKLSLALQAHGIETDFFSLRDAVIGNPILLQPLNFAGARKKLAECDFIHAGGDATYVASLWKPFTAARIVFDVHGDTLQEAKMQWSRVKQLRSAHQVIQAFITNLVQFRAADRFLFVSKPMKRWLSHVKRRPVEHMALVRNGVDLGLFQRIPTASNKDFVVTYAGGFSVWQGIENLVEAMEKIPDQNIRLQIIGVTSKQKTMADQITKRLGNRVELLQRMDQPQLVARLSAADVLVIPRTDHPALRVALPTKFAEYLALAKPVIVSNIDETADLVRTHGCGLVSEPNSDDLAQTLTNMSNLTRAEREQMGQRARNLAEHEFSWEEIGKHYAESLLRWSN